MIQFENLKSFREITHGVMEVKEGSFNFYTNPEAVNNLLNCLKKSGETTKKENLVLAEQIHGKKIHHTSQKTSGYIKLGVDGLISKKRGEVIAVKTADCLPVLMFNPVKKIVGAIHAGRRGVKKKIIQNTVDKMKNKKSLIVGIGPHIKKCCYGFENKDFSKKLENSQWKKYACRKNDKVYLDLTQAALDQLTDSGVSRKNIEVSKYCTFCQYKRFFSARKTKQKNPYPEYGRFPETGSFITLRKK